MKDFCVIPARSGSKGLKDKNILPLGGMPVLAWSINVAKDSGIFKDVFVATDSPVYARIAEEHGAVVPELLPVDLVQDHVSSTEPVLHLLNLLKLSPERVWCLQPTSPFRKAEDILSARDVFLHYPDTACVLSVTPLDPHFFHWALEEKITPEKEGSVAEMWFGNRFLMDRAFLPEALRPNGMIKVARTDVLRVTRHFFTQPLRTIRTPEERSIHIRNALDFAFCSYLVQKNE